MANDLRKGGQNVGKDDGEKINFFLENNYSTAALFIECKLFPYCRLLFKRSLGLCTRGWRQKFTKIYKFTVSKVLKLRLKLQPSLCNDHSNKFF